MRRRLPSPRRHIASLARRGGRDGAGVWASGHSAIGWPTGSFWTAGCATSTATSWWPLSVRPPPWMPSWPGCAGMRPNSLRGHRHPFINTGTAARAPRSSPTCRAARNARHAGVRPVPAVRRRKGAQRPALPHRPTPLPGLRPRLSWQDGATGNTSHIGETGPAAGGCLDRRGKDRRGQEAWRLPTSLRRSTPGGGRRTAPRQGADRQDLSWSGTSRLWSAWARISRTERAALTSPARPVVLIHGPSAGGRAGSRPGGLAARSRRPSHPCGRSCVPSRPPRDEPNAVTAPGPFGPGRKAPAHGPSEDEF